MSEKSVSRYIAQGRLPDRRVKGALDVEPADVERLKAELETPVVTDAPANAPETAIERAPVAPRLLVPQRRQKAPETALSLEALAGAVLAIADKMDKAGRDEPSVAEKLLLSIDEAAMMSSVSSAQIRLAIRQERLPARRIGRGFKIRPDDLKAWTNSFFKEPINARSQSPYEFKNNFLNDDTPVGLQYFTSTNETLTDEAASFLLRNGIPVYRCTEKMTHQKTGKERIEHGVGADCTNTQMHKAFAAAIMNCSRNDSELAKAGLTDQKDLGADQYQYKVIVKFPPDDLETKEPTP